MNFTRWTTTISLVLIYLVLWSFSPAGAQTPSPVTPGYQVPRTNDPGNTQTSFQPVDLNHGLPVDLVAGSVTAALAPFTPSAAGSRGTPLTVSTTSVSGTIPTNTGAVVLANNGATTANCNVVGAAATAADFPISPGGAVLFGVPSGVTTFSCISTGSGTTVNSIGGNGLGAFTGGGGGSSGGGGVVTQPTASLLQTTTTPASGSVYPLNATPTLANGNGVVLTQGGSVLSATNPSFGSLVQRGNTAHVSLG